MSSSAGNDLRLLHRDYWAVPLLSCGSRQAFEPEVNVSGTMARWSLAKGHLKVTGVL
jgi:hypothetical protein